MRLRLCIGALFAVFPIFCYADDLLQLYRDALRNDPKFSSARADYLAKIEAFPQARADLLPQVSLRSNIANNTSSTEGQAGNSFQSRSYSFSLTQPLFRWDQWQSYLQGKLTIATAGLNLAKAKQDLLTRLTKGYFEALTAQEVLVQATAHKQALLNQLALAKRSFELGNATIADVNQVQAEHDQAVADEIDAQNTLNNKRALLEQIVNHRVVELATIAPATPVPNIYPTNMNLWIDQAKRYHYDVQLGEVAVENADRDISKAYSGHLPTVDLVASRSYSNTGSADSLNNIVTGVQNNASAPNKSNQIGVQMSIPIFSGFSVQSKVRQMVAQKDKATQDLDDARRAAVAAAQQAYWGVSSGLVKIAALQTAEKSALVALSSSSRGYQLGYKLNVDVLNAQDKLYQARRDLVKARNETIVASFDLKASAANLDETDIIKVNSLLAGNSQAETSKPALPVAPLRQTKANHPQDRSLAKE